jgi:hypothetical protein
MLLCFAVAAPCMECFAVAASQYSARLAVGVAACSVKHAKFGMFFVLLFKMWHFCLFCS